MLTQTRQIRMILSQLENNIKVVQQEREQYAPEIEKLRKEIEELKKENETLKSKLDNISED